MASTTRSTSSWPDTLRIGRRTIGHGKTPFVIAELSGNHGQDIRLARKLIDAAANAGADAVKLQTYTPDTITLPARTDPFRIADGLWKGRFLHDLYREAMTPWEWHGRLAEHARNRGLVLFSTPFDETAVDFIEESIDPPLFKIASFEVNHLPLLKKVGATKKPVLMSTGMATAAEIRVALHTLRSSGCTNVVLLKCVSAYPSDPKDFNLRSITSLRNKFGVPVGLSDHTMTNEVATASVALGACVIEKHLVLDRNAGGIDSGFSLEPVEFAEMTSAARTVFSAMGSTKIGPTKQDEGQLKFRRSIFVAKDIKRGEPFTEKNLKIVRPADGLNPSMWEKVLGKRAKRTLDAGSPLKRADV